MARQRMVTRTVEEMTVEVMCLDVSTAQASVHEFICANIKDEKALMKSLKKAHETDTFKLVQITNVSTREVLYGMPEQDFIHLAKVLPPRQSNSDDE